MIEDTSAVRRDDTKRTEPPRLAASDLWCLEEHGCTRQVTAYDEHWFLGRPRRP